MQLRSLFVMILSAALGARAARISRARQAKQQKDDSEVLSAPTADSALVSDLCSEAAVRRGCGTLAQDAVPEQSDRNTIDKDDFQAYFVAEMEDVSAFWANLKLTSSVSCQQLCTKTLSHIARNTQWQLPEERGLYCANWSTDANPTCLQQIPLSDAAMERVAGTLDLSAAKDKFNKNVLNHSTSTEHMDSEITIAADENNATTKSSKYHYGVNDLAIELARIFNVFPSTPKVSSSSSILEGDPDFGSRVRTDRYATWQATFAQSQSWVRSALAKLPGNLNALRIWFGGADKATMDAVRNILVGMQLTLDHAKVVVGDPPTCSPTSATMAYVSVSRYLDGSFAHSEKEDERYVIHVCERYWKPEFISDDSSKYGTLVHESAHHHGPGDEPYNGASPYGRAQAMRMAKEAPAKAQNNADNYAWLVYYLNRCSNAATSTSSTAPCSLELEDLDGGGVKISATCKKDVSGVTVKFTDVDGTYLQQASNFGSMTQGSWVLHRLHLPDDTRVVLFYESECVFWEAAAMYKQSDRGRREYAARATHVLSAGGDAEPDSEDATTPTPTPEPPASRPDDDGSTSGTLPCELTTKDVTLTDDSEGFTLLVRCDRDVSDARLSFEPPAGISETYRDKHYGTIAAGSNWQLITLRKSDNIGWRFVFSATGGSVAVDAP